ncbi:MAG TPA: hypothetical protein VGO41_10430 [Steroidobacteraceae bacterium]|jgi:hypothetical protein|nr:hypothetical protein [Steroidobacteraceae bacterium]
MNSDDDDIEDALTREYRRASADQAGRPDAATRAAILAEARAAALRRTPAANDSRLWWRAAASVAVVGVGVLLWRQVDRDVATLAPAAPVVVQVETPGAGEAVSADAAADTDVAANAAGQAQERARAPAQAPTPAQAPAPAAGAARSQQRAESESAAQALVAPPSPSPQTGTLERGAAAVFDSASRSLARKATRDATAEEMLQTGFPAEYTSSSPPRALWVLQDAAGSVLRNGALGDNEEFAAMTSRLERDYPGRRIGPWRVTPVKNSQGVELQLGVALLQ